MSSLVYVYGVVDSPIAEALEGIDGGAVRWVAHDGLVAAVSDVPGEDFEEEPLNANIADMSWLGPRAVAHQDVNSHLFDATEALVPLAFGTVFRDDARVRGLLMARATTLKSQLKRVRGSAEWVVALHVLREPNASDVAAASTTVQELQQQIAGSSPGRAHLLRRQLAAVERDEARRIQAEAGTHLLEALRGVAREVFQEPLPADTVERPLLRATVLVARADEAAFMGEVDRLRTRWPEPTYRLLLTGPWPAYRFGGLEAWT